MQAAWLPRIADGAALVVLAQQERGARYRLDAVVDHGQRTPAGGWSLNGAKSLVPAGDEADAFIVPARVGPHAIGADRPVPGRARRAAAVRGYPTQDGARAADVTLATAPATLVLADGRERARTRRDIGIAAACAEAVGLMDKLLAITVEYMNTRKQFGVAIASFQALRHRIADVKMQLELARSMSYYASLKLGRAGRRSAAAPCRRPRSSSASRCASSASSASSCTAASASPTKYIASHYFKRLTMLELAFGDTLHHLGEVSASACRTRPGVFA